MASYYERLAAAAAELFGEGTTFNFCRVKNRKHYHQIVRYGDHAPEFLADVLLAGIPAGKRIVATFEAAAECVGNIDLMTIRTVLQKHGL